MASEEPTFCTWHQRLQQEMAAALPDEHGPQSVKWILLSKLRQEADSGRELTHDEE